MTAQNRDLLYTKELKKKRLNKKTEEYEESSSWRSFIFFIVVT